MVTKPILIHLEEKLWQKFKEQTKERGIILRTAVAQLFRDAVKRGSEGTEGR